MDTIPRPQKPARPFRVFISYAREDLTYLDALTNHLKPLKDAGWLEPWTDQALVPGEQWEPTLLTKLAEADVILLLDSPDFAASEFIQRVELPTALARRQAGKVELVRVRVRPVYRPADDPLQAFQFLPRDGKAVSDAEERLQDGVWLKIARELHKLLEGMARREQQVEPTVAAPAQHGEAGPTQLGASSPAPGPKRTVLSRWLPWLGGALLLLLVGLALLRWRQTVLELDTTPQAMLQEPKSPCSAADRKTLQAIPPLPLTLIWLEERDDPDFSEVLEAPARLRGYLKRLGAELGRQGVKAIALDLYFSASEGKSDLEEFLGAAHRNTPRIPVMAVRPQKDSVVPECGQSTAPACFDALADAGLIAGDLVPGQPVEALEPCIHGTAAPSRVVGQWLKQYPMTGGGELRTESSCTSESILCVEAQLLESPPWQEVSSGDYLKNPLPVGIVLIGIQSDADTFPLKTLEGSEKATFGVRLHALGAALYAMR